MEHIQKDDILDLLKSEGVEDEKLADAIYDWIQMKGNADRFTDLALYVRNLSKKEESSTVWRQRVMQICAEYNWDPEDLIGELQKAAKICTEAQKNSMLTFAIMFLFFDWKFALDLLNSCNSSELRPQAYEQQSNQPAS